MLLWFLGCGDVVAPPGSRTEPTESVGAAGAERRRASEAALDSLLPAEGPRRAAIGAVWSARFRADADAAEAAARIAVSRAPEDPESLALLAETTADPSLREAAATRLSRLAPGSPEAARANAAWQMSEGLWANARDSLAPCAAELLPCAWARARLDAGLGSPGVSDRFDQLYARWSPNGALVVEAAREAVVAGSPLFGGEPGDDAAAKLRIDAAQKRLPKLVTLDHLRGVLRLARADIQGGARLLRTADASRDPLVRLAAAMVAESAQDTSRVLLLLDSEAPASLDADRALRWRIVRGRALARQPAARLPRDGAEPAARLKAAAAALSDRDGPEAIQARLLLAAALQTLDPAGYERDLGQIEALKGARGVAASRAWMTAAEIAQAAGRTADVELAVTAARDADPSDPTAWWWLARLRLDAGDAPAAVGVLRGAVAAVDGSAEDRHPLLGGVRTAAPSAEVRTRLGTTTDDPRISLRFPAAVAAAAWLAGDLAAAERALALAEKNDATALAIEARVRLARGDSRGARTAATELMRIEGANDAWRTLYADVLLAAGAKDEAIAALAQIHAPGSHVWVARAGLLPDQQKQALEAARELDPLCLRAWGVEAR